MAYTNLVPFDRLLTGASLLGVTGRYCTPAELAAVDESAYRRGVDDTRTSADQQMVELRADIEQLARGLFQKLAATEPALLAQLRGALPGLTVELSRRLLAGYEPPAEVVVRLCEEALDELFPERENLQLVISERDATLLEKLSPAWTERYPGLRITRETTLSPGDCQVRSRFGLTDARLKTKLDALERTLVPA